MQCERNELHKFFSITFMLYFFIHISGLDFFLSLAYRLLCWTDFFLWFNRKFYRINAFLVIKRFHYMFFILFFSYFDYREFFYVFISYQIRNFHKLFEFTSKIFKSILAKGILNQQTFWWNWNLWLYSLISRPAI